MNSPIRSAASSLVTRAEQRAILTVTCSAAFLFFNSFGSIGVALPTMQKQFGSSLAAIQWVSLMGTVAVSSLSLCFGRAGSILGQKRIYKTGVALYTIGAGFGALANSFAALLSARVVMAIGLAMAVPMSTAILATAFEPKSRGRALGTFASAVAVGRMTGPTIGGFLLELGGWPWIFWMNFLIGSAVTLAVGKIFLGPGEQRHEPFDVWGSLLLLLSYPALLLGLTFAPTAGWTSSFVAGCFIVGLVGLPIFVWIELRTKKPLIEITMFKHKVLAAAVAAAVLCNITHYPVGLCAPLYLQNVLGASAVVTGLVLAVLPLSTALASWISGRLADRLDAALIACVGLLLIFGGIVYYSGLETDHNLVYIIGALAVVGTGLGIFTPSNQKVAFASVQQDDYAVLAAILSSFGTAAGTIGTTMAVALMELRGGQRLWAEPVVFASAQHFAFSCLAPIGLLALLIAYLSRTADSHR